MDGKITTKRPSTKAIVLGVICSSGICYNRISGAKERLMTGVRDHALLADNDAQFWIGWLVKDLPKSQQLISCGDNCYS